MSKAKPAAPEKPPAAEETPARAETLKLAEADLQSIRNSSSLALVEIVKTQTPKAEAGDAFAALWVAAATREHVEIRGVPLPVEEPDPGSEVQPE